MLKLRFFFHRKCYTIPLSNKLGIFIFYKDCTKYRAMKIAKPYKILPLDPSISFFRAGAEYGSCLSMSEACSSKMDDSSTRRRAGGMSCFKI